MWQLFYSLFSIWLTNEFLVKHTIPRTDQEKIWIYYIMKSSTCTYSMHLLINWWKWAWAWNGTKFSYWQIQHGKKQQTHDHIVKKRDNYFEWQTQSSIMQLKKNGQTKKKHADYVCRRSAMYKGENQSKEIVRQWKRY